MFDTLLEIATHGNTCVVIVKSDIDIATAETFGRYAREASIGYDALVLSLGACPYIDSSGIRPIVRFARERGDDFAIVVPRGSRAHRVFELMNLAACVRIFETLDAALAFQDLRKSAIA